MADKKLCACEEGRGCQDDGITYYTGDEVGQLIHDRAAARNELKAAQATIRSLTAVVEQAEKHVEDRDQRNVDLAADLLEERSQRRHFAEQLDMANAEVAELREKVEALRSDLAEARDFHEQFARDLDGRLNQAIADRDRLSDEVARLNATIVRLSKRESVSGLCEVGYDKVTCIEAGEAHRRIYHGGSPIPAYARKWAGLNSGGED
jgi:chromosome segregation ATPase